MTGVRKYGTLGAALFTIALLGCVDEEIVYRDKPLFEDPPANAVGFSHPRNACETRNDDHENHARVDSP